MITDKLTKTNKSKPCVRFIIYIDIYSVCLSLLSLSLSMYIYMYIYMYREPELGGHRLKFD